MSGRKDREKLRLAELILSGGANTELIYDTRPPTSQEGRAYIQPIIDLHVEVIRQGTKVVVDNVTEYYFTLPDGKMEALDELPSIAPPWNDFWVESRRMSNMPKDSRSIPLWGISVSSISHGPEGVDGEAFRQLQLLQVTDNPSVRDDFEENCERIEGRVHWFCAMMLWVPVLAEPGGRMNGGRPLSSLILPLGEDGRPMKTTNDSTPIILQGISLPPSHEIDTEEGQQAYMEAVKETTLGLVQPLLLGVSFMHMKDVVLYDLWRSPKERKAVRRVTGDGPEYFRTVVIDPDMDVEVRSKQGRGIGAARAMHLVRGHFVTYTEERPMGRNKIVGTFWRGAHFRGDRARGLVKKDYEVNPPKSGRELK
jgi:hypothetical protein